MNQLTQKLKSGEMRIQDVPVPIVGPGMVLVRNHYSLISAGTEGSTVKTARKSMIGKAKERPQQVKQVIDVLKKQGPVQTYRAVMKKLDAYSPLGYSSAGIVIEVGEGVRGFAVGDKAACAGVGYANHAEVVSVPENLCVKLDDSANLKSASYNTLGAIALQGIRQADLRLGEHCAVIGLGLIGQLTCLMLRTSGINTSGIDIDPAIVEKVIQNNCADYAWIRSQSGITEHIEALTNGIGVDAVIITAGTSSLDPVNFAGKIARKKGKVIIVGNVPTGFDRDPYYYKKELELKMSCSYGPGRYDLNYEEKGIDYPAAYVRWTEKRNMEAFQELIRTGRIDLDFMTTHVFPLADSPKAYDIVVNRSEPFLGILIKYDVEKPLKRSRVKVTQPKPVGKVGLAFIGAGSYAQGSLLPNLPKNGPDVVNKAVMTSSGTTSKTVAEKFGFEFCTSDKEEIFDNDRINTVFISTRHNTHAGYVLDALKAGKNIFVEKPLCLTPDELHEIQTVFSASCQLPAGSSILMVGYNRRFAPLARILKEKLGSGPMAMIYRVNAGSIPPDNWIQDPDIGGGRILGEVCHFIDFMTFMSGSLPARVYASALPDSQDLNDTVTINLEFADGSTGTIAYLANGAKSLAKEYVEIYKSGNTGIIRDFKELEIHGSGKPYRKKLMSQDKGQKEMLARFIEAVKDGKTPPIIPDEIFSVTRLAFYVLESIRTRAAISVDA
jgi:polar amino acid transport system substrate-binding protein